MAITGKEKFMDMMSDGTGYKTDMPWKARRKHLWHQLSPYREALTRSAEEFIPYDWGGLVRLIIRALDYMENYHRLSGLSMQSERNVEEIRRAKAMAEIVKSGSRDFEEGSQELKLKEYKVNVRNAQRFLPDRTGEDLPCNKEALLELRTAKAAHILFTMLEYYYRNWWD